MSHGGSGRASSAAGGSRRAPGGAAVPRRRPRLPGRVRGLGVSVPGTVRDGHTLDASYLGWRDIASRVLWPRAGLFASDNDATLAALAESLRGAAVCAALSLRRRVDAGIFGAIVEQD